MKTVDFRFLSDTLYGIALHGNAQTACIERWASLTAFTAGGGLNFSGDGMWRQDVLGHGGR